jgi:uncharacterized protein
MVVYVDSSALVKRYIREDGSETVNEWLTQADSVSCSRIGFVEVYRAIMLSGAEQPERIGHDFSEDWTLMAIIEVYDSLVRRAASLAPSIGLRSMDAIHLASAETLRAADLTVLTWDRRLWRGCQFLSIPVIPTAEPGG